MKWLFAGWMASKERMRGRVWWWLGLLLVAVVACPALLGLFSKQRGGPGHDYVRSVNNMKSIGLALVEFGSNYGSLPNDQSIAKVMESNPGYPHRLETAHAQDYFNQLIAAETIRSNEMFYGRGIALRRPLDTTSMRIEAGECGFAYILSEGGLEALSPDRPVVVYPIVRGRFRFDREISKLWGHKAAVLHVDNSVKSYPVEKDGRVLVNGKDLFDPSQPFWGGEKPVVKWPE